ncbi:hypothetical protein AMECASPLE_032148 [Ameca splendens]|uniref:Uncharacterized protein n=1 Tax=Ameca splendens TaxID=208324 RepID=A0ABV0YTG2_9TELE
MVLDLLTASVGGVWALLNETCCTYIPNETSDEDGHRVSDAIHQSVISTAYSIVGCGCLSPAVYGREAGYTLDRSLVHSKATVQPTAPPCSPAIRQLNEIKRGMQQDVHPGRGSLFFGGLLQDRGGKCF